MKNIMNLTRLFTVVLIAGTMAAFLGCTKTEENEQSSSAVETQRTVPAENKDDKPQVPAPAEDSGASSEHEVVMNVRTFVKAIEDGDYDQAIDMGTPNEFNREGLGQVNDAFEFVQIEIAQAFVGELNAAVLIDSVSGPSGPGQFGFSLIKSGNRWLIRDVDWLPGTDDVGKWLAGFNGVEPNATSVAGAD
jgi:hypothetical protein